MSNASELSMFGDIYDVDMSAMQMESIASDLVFLLKHSGLSRSELASRLGWNKSRVTRILSGDENLTIKTITSVAECLGYGFDVIFYNENYEQPKQPWNIDRDNKKLIISNKVSARKVFNLEIQTGEQVVNDVLAGNESDRYIRVTEGNDNNINYLLQKDSDLTLSVFPTSHKTFKYDLTSKVVDYEC